MHVFRFICHPWSLTHNPLLELRWEELWAGFGSCSRRKVWFCHEFQASSWKGHPQVWAGCCINLPLKVLSTGCPWNSGTHPLCLGNFMFPQILPENTPWIFLINHFMFGLVYGRAWSCVGLKIFFFCWERQAGNEALWGRRSLSQCWAVMDTLEKTEIEICTATAFPSWDSFLLPWSYHR